MREKDGFYSYFCSGKSDKQVPCPWFEVFHVQYVNY